MLTFQGENRVLHVSRPTLTLVQCRVLLAVIAAAIVLILLSFWGEGDTPAALLHPSSASTAASTAASTTASTAYTAIH